MNLISLFSGIGAFEKALERLKIDFRLIFYSEIDKYASKSYSMIHSVSEEKNMGDVTKIDLKAFNEDVDVLTYGFPCQDISIAGHGKGFEHNGQRTRSGLFFEALRIIEDTKPKIAIAENVKNLTSKKFKNEFEIVLSSLEKAGYNNYWKVLNSKDFGIPQNRERVFIVSIRKDIDNNEFEFPEGFELTLTPKDMLEDEVDEKFYLTDKQIERIKNSNFTQERTRIQKNVCGSLLARDYKDPKCVEVADFRYDEGLRVRKKGLCPTITTKMGTGGGLSGKPLILESKVIGSTQKNSYFGSVNGESPTLTSAMGSGGGHVPMITNQYAVRKLTPKECFRLMGFDDLDFDKIKGISNSQLYKQAGNSIVVNVLEYLIQKILDIKVI